MASNISLRVLQGNDVTAALSVLASDGTSPQDCTGLTPVMVIKGFAGAGDYTGTELTIGAGLTWVAQSQGTLTASLSHVLLAGQRAQWWRLDVLDGTGDRTTAMYGPLLVTAV